MNRGKDEEAEPEDGCEAADACPLGQRSRVLARSAGGACTLHLSCSALIGRLITRVIPRGSDRGHEPREQFVAQEHRSPHRWWSRHGRPGPGSIDVSVAEGRRVVRGPLGERQRRPAHQLLHILRRRSRTPGVVGEGTDQPVGHVLGHPGGEHALANLLGR
jgi:hypothetical protein